MWNVLIADDHELLRHGVQRAIEGAFKDAHIVEVGDSNELLRHVHERPWDLILMDVLMPGVGLRETLTRIRSAHAAVPILVFTGLTEIDCVAVAMDAGANGVIHKDRAASDLITAIQVVTSGGIFLHPEVAAALEANRRALEALPHRKLSEREAEIFRLIAVGRPIKDIAKDLDLSDKTVTTYLARIREKTGLTSYVEIARYALQHGLVQ